MADIGHELTEDILSGLEELIKEEYARALADAEEKVIKYFRKFEKGKLEQKALLDAGKITEKEYKDWLYRHTMMGQQWKDLEKVLAEDFTHANEIALQISRGQMPDIYAVNANYATYQIEHDGKIDTSFTLYNHDTAELLMKNEHVQLMPRPSTKKAAQIAANKDMQWNMRKIQSAVLQGVLQGESPFEVAHRLEQVGQMNFNSAVRYARTMGTSAQNAGRYQAYRRAEDLGVKLTIEWQATLDGRTRHDHRMMHGQRRDVGEPFETPDGFSIMYPADCSGESDAPQREIWNCRCTLLSWVKGFEGDTVKDSPKMGNMTFEEWQQENAPKQKPKPVKNVASEATKSSVEHAKVNNVTEYDETLLKSLKDSKVEYRDVKDLPSPLSEEEIIDRLAGGDMTKGSCASLSLAYAGNKNNYDVLDFRDGESRRIFSHRFREFAQMSGVEPFTAKTASDITGANQLLKNMEKGKEYILCTGRHAAVVRKVESGFEYLELQSDTGKGWHALTNDALRWRFACKKTHSSYGYKYSVTNYLIDIDKLNQNGAFREVLGYINTDPTKQVKGYSGTIK